MNAKTDFWIIYYLSYTFNQLFLDIFAHRIYNGIPPKDLICEGVRLYVWYMSVRI